jgi:hypothetical protein
MSKYGYGYCDRTGFRYPIADLVEEYVQGNPTGLRVGKDMVDPDHPQNWAGLQGPYTDPTPLDHPRPPQDLRQSRAQFAFNPVGGATLEVTCSVGVVTAS